ncbi:MAG: hypothetical protein K2M13_09890 [Muribaculaceae bacterium]|nr:hypothetical protein [Muribaculaceae bacterium]
MIKPNLVGIADIEKLNASELNNVKGGACSFAQDSWTEDSEHHDSDNNDTFNGHE